MSSILQPEAAIWYSICWLVVGLRLYSKKMARGSWKRFTLEDYMVFPIMALITIIMVVLHFLIRKDQAMLLSPGNDLVYETALGSYGTRTMSLEFLVAIEQLQLVTAFMLKASMLIMYARMTDLSRLQLVVKAIAICVAIGFITVEVLWLGVWCRPLKLYLEWPATNIQCSTMSHHLITTAVVSVISDLAIMAISIPIIYRLQVPKTEKGILVCIFLLGAFNIVATVMSKHESLAHPQSPKWMMWYLREDFTALLCANLPCTCHLLRSWVSKLAMFGRLSSSTSDGLWLLARGSRLASSSGTPGASSHSPSDVELDNFSNIGNLDTIADGLQEPLASAAPPEPVYETEIQISRREIEWSDEEALIRMRREDRLEYM